MNGFISEPYNRIERVSIFAMQLLLCKAGNVKRET